MIKELTQQKDNNPKHVAPNPKALTPRRKNGQNPDGGTADPEAHREGPAPPPVTAGGTAQRRRVHRGCGKYQATQLPLREHPAQQQNALFQVHMEHLLGKKTSDKPQRM